ncbi:hypothetical protein SAMN05446037_101670 [Anaerovirgula multivorans]|uniref:Uncharacterized protein n=1 Tax=Anaerovirgula multivorans TaxID=312168 RepID=A0A239GDN5_9FIRM|nr:hypothetical protein SAMN05446037_101670 [Anaerovirgula multivorans]
MKSISFKLDENKVVNTSAWLVSLIQFANLVRMGKLNILIYLPT